MYLTSYNKLLPRKLEGSIFGYVQLAYFECLIYGIMTTSQRQYGRGGEAFGSETGRLLLDSASYYGGGKVISFFFFLMYYFLVAGCPS